MIFFHLTAITITTSGGLTNFSDKLPGKARRIVGIILTSSAVHATKAICQIGISMNGGKEYPVNQIISSHNNDPVKKTYPLRFDIKHDRNSITTGYVEDFGQATSYPYVVKINFMLED